MRHIIIVSAMNYPPLVFLSPVIKLYSQLFPCVCENKPITKWIGYPLKPLENDRLTFNKNHFGLLWKFVLPDLGQEIFLWFKLRQRESVKMEDDKTCSAKWPRYTLYTYSSISVVSLILFSLVHWLKNEAVGVVMDLLNDMVGQTTESIDIQNFGIYLWA